MELIIVCSLAALFLTISIPTLRNNLYVDQLDTTARKLIGTVQELRNLAVRQHKDYLLHFNVEENHVWYEVDENKGPLSDDEPEGVSTLPNDVTIVKIETHSQGVANSGKVTLWVSRKGFMDQTVVQLREENGEDVSILFSPFSGAAQVYEEEVSLE